MGATIRSLGWLALSAALAAGLAWWSLYLVGLAFLFGVGLAVTGVPESRRMRRATSLAVLMGYESSLACLVGLYRFAWGQRSGGFYLYLGILAALGLLITGAILLFRSRRSAAHADAR